MDTSEMQLYMTNDYIYIVLRIIVYSSQKSLGHSSKTTTSELFLKLNFAFRGAFFPDPPGRLG